MPWKVDDKEALVVENENPVWIYEGGDKDGKEAPVVFPKTLSTIARLTAESTDRKAKINDYKTLLVPIEEAGIEDLSEFITKANEAIETVGNLDEARNADATKIEQLKESFKTSYETKIETLKMAHGEEITKLSDTLTDKEKSIRDLVVKGAFDRSDFLKEETVLLPELAYSFFGERFDVEAVDGNLVGFAKDKEGNKLMSLANPGEIATPTEAIELLVNEHPQKDKLLKLDASGSGTPPNSNGSGKGADLTAQYNKAKENRNMPQMVALKSQMAEAGIPIPL